MGDDWDDGHGKVERVIIKSNFNKDQINVAYKKGVEIVGVNITDACKAFEDNIITKDNIKLLRDSGINIELQNDLDDGEVHLLPNKFCEIFLSICEVGNPMFEYEIFKIPEIDIGGYGLFFL